MENDFRKESGLVKSASVVLGTLRVAFSDHQLKCIESSAS